MCLKSHLKTRQETSGLACLRKDEKAIFLGSLTTGQAKKRESRERDPKFGILAIERKLLQNGKWQIPENKTITITTTKAETETKTPG
jgi:hypothetical protein